MAGRKHGRVKYFIEGEGAAPITLPSPRRTAFGVVTAAAAMAPPPVDPDRAFRFGRMFPDLPPGVFDDAALIALGKAMEDVAGPATSNSTVSAGFTYLGQFVDHDTTFDRTDGLPSGVLDPDEILQGRSPSLDLDSVYGRGPIESPELYEADQTHLRLGMTTGRTLFGVTQQFPNDLPRKPRATDASDREAIIGDPRNDENLAVAQTHVAFLKFHNKVVDALSIAPAGSRFEMARKVVVQHYQSIVLHDFVRRIADPSVFTDVISHGRRFFRPEPIPDGEHPAMPVEFSVAAYRLGHSMIRNTYRWNRVFNSGGPSGLNPPLSLLFEFSRVSGNLGGEDTLPSDWIADWNRLYDFSERPGGARHPQLNSARLIDANLANDLKNLPQFQMVQEEHLKFLAVRNLLRGRLLNLPTGQTIADALGTPALAPMEVASGGQGELVASMEFAEKTPLWFYILKEAEVQRGGESLGVVGSRLVVETFHALIEASQHSILKEPGWQPTLPAVDPTRFKMTDLLSFVNDLDPIG